MDKAVYAGSIIISLALIAGSVLIPNSAAMWLASTSDIMNIARVILIVMMIGLFVTNPPRSLRFRRILGAVSLSFVGIALVRTFGGSVHIIDALLFFEAAVAFGLAAIEAEPLPSVSEEDNYVEKGNFVYRNQPMQPGAVSGTLQKILIAAMVTGHVHLGSKHIGPMTHAR